MRKAGMTRREPTQRQSDNDVYDAQNRLKTTTDCLGSVTTNNYNCFRLASIVDAEGQMTSYTYNIRGEKIKETYPDHLPPRQTQKTK